MLCVACVCLFVFAHVRMRERIWALQEAERTSSRNTPSSYLDIEAEIMQCDAPTAIMHIGKTKYASPSCFYR